MRQICFNPLPARRPGATVDIQNLIDVVQVSILSQPEGRELLKEFPQLKGFINVSILSQPEGRELPVRPAFRLESGIVSILSQPEGRELRGT